MIQNVFAGNGIGESSSNSSLDLGSLSHKYPYEFISSRPSYAFAAVGGGGADLALNLWSAVIREQLWKENLLGTGLETSYI